MPTTRTLPFLLAVLVLAACNAAAAPSPTPAPTPEPTPTAVPGPGGVGGGGSGGSGVVPPGGIVDPGAGGDPILGNPNLVAPVAGLVNQHPVSVQLIRAAVDSTGATVEVRWWSGVAPCSVLDSVQVAKDDSARTIKLTVIEGSGPGNQACIDIAELKATVVDLGTLASGAWTISADGDAPAITLEVS